jgi:lipocalin
MSTAPDFRTETLMTTDKELKESKTFKDVHAKYGKLASEDSIKKAAKALEEKGHKVSIVEGKDFVKFLDGLIPAGASYGASGSTGLEQLGWTEHMKANPDKWNNLKGKAVAEMIKGNMAGYGKFINESITADYWVSTVHAVAETGELVSGSASFRIPLQGPKNLILVASTQKIVADYDSALKRLTDYCLPLESARARIVYKVPASNLTEITTIRTANPWNKNSHVILVKGSYGF